jgi:hypothetical protein
MSQYGEPFTMVRRGHSHDLMDVDNASGNTVLTCVGEHLARRITACINACAELPTDILEREKYPQTASYEMRRKVERERDALLAVVKKLHHYDSQRDGSLMENDKLWGEIERLATTVGGAL